MVTTAQLRTYGILSVTILNNFHLSGRLIQGQIESEEDQHSSQVQQFGPHNTTRPYSQPSFHQRRFISSKYHRNAVASGIPLGIKLESLQCSQTRYSCTWGQAGKWHGREQRKVKQGRANFQKVNGPRKEEKGQGREGNRRGGESKNESTSRRSKSQFCTIFFDHCWSVPLSQRSPENCCLQTHRKPPCCRLSSLQAPPLRQQLGQQGDFAGVCPESTAPRSLVRRLNLLPLERRPPTIVSAPANFTEMSKVQRTTNITNVIKVIFAKFTITSHAAS